MRLSAATRLSLLLFAAFPGVALSQSAFERVATTLPEGRAFAAIAPADSGLGPPA